MGLSEEEILNINKKNKLGLTAIFKAVEKQDRLKVYNYLKVKNIDLNVKTKEGEPLLFFAFGERLGLLNNKKIGTEIVEDLLNDARVDKHVIFKGKSLLNLLASHFNDAKKFKHYEYLYNKERDDANSFLIDSIKNDNYNIADYLLNKKNTLILNYENMFLSGELNNLIIKYAKPTKKSERINQQLINIFFNFKETEKFPELFKKLLNECIKNDKAELIDKFFHIYPIDINYTLSNKDLYHTIFSHRAYNVFKLLLNKNPVIEYYKQENNIYFLCASLLAKTESFYKTSYCRGMPGTRNLYDFIQLLNKNVMKFSPEIYEIYLCEGIDKNFPLNDLNELTDFTINSHFFSRQEKAYQHIFNKMQDYNQYIIKKLLRWMQDNNYDFTQKDEDSNSLLHMMMNHRDTNFIIQLVEQLGLSTPETLNHKNNSGDTFLHVIAKKQYVELNNLEIIIDFAIKNGFDFDSVNNNGKVCYLIEFPDIKNFNENYLFYMKQIIEKHILNKITGHDEKNRLLKRL